KDVADQRKKGVEYLKQQILTEMSEVRAKINKHEAQKKAQIEQMQQKEGPGALETIGAGIKAAPGAVADAAVSNANTGRQAAGATATVMSAKSEHVPGAVKDPSGNASQISRDVGAGVGMVGVAKAMYDYEKLASEPK